LFWIEDWERFKEELPHQKKPYSKRNWGNKLHSLCSYQGKLKPSIAHYLVKIFVPEEGTILDPFSGAGTISLEAALQGKKSYAFDLSPVAYVVTKAKLEATSAKNTSEVISNLENFLEKNEPTDKELTEAKEFGFNSNIAEYYHEDTLDEVLIARRFFSQKDELDASTAFVMACTLHILHGNRPYALSRRSHPMTPYAPKGNFEYRPLIPRLKDKVKRSLPEEDITNPTFFKPVFREGITYKLDSTEWWPYEVDNLDAIITSPPFFDSTRFYMFNWLRIWFAGWSPSDFKDKPAHFIDERQENSFEVYENIIRQSRERLKEKGVLVFHLGKSNKCDMAENILRIAKPWFSNYDILDEDVTHTEKHGIKDKGTVTSHEYLILY